MDKERIQDIIKCIMIIFVIVLIIYFSFYRKTEDEKIEITKQEELQSEINELKTEKQGYEEKISELESQLEELQKNYEYEQESVNILTEQLESHGIEPDEL